MRAEIAELFEFDPTLVHLNHGSFGAVPRVVREAQDRIRAEVEQAPMRSFKDVLPQRIAAARAGAADFLGVPTDSVALVRNATEGVGSVLDSLRIGPGDEVVVTNHGYGTVAMSATARGATTAMAAFPVDGSPADVVTAVRAAVTPATRLVVIDQITSPTALVLPVAEVAAAVAPIPVLVDAAHVPGALSGLDIEALGAAFWVGNLHKWAYAPRGTACLWVSEPFRDVARPLVTSWSHGQPFPARFDLQGTVDHSAWCASGHGLRFWAELGGFEQVQSNAELLLTGADIVAEALGTQSPLGQIPSAPSMRLVALPEGVVTSPETSDALWQRVYAAGFVVPPIDFEGRGYLRLAAAAYNDEDDYARLGATLVRLLG